MMRQAKILKDKKITRMAKLAKQLRPQIEAGVVKYAAPIAKQMQEIRQFAAPAPPAPPVRTARMVIPKIQQTQQQQETRQQNVNPKKIVRKEKGCSGCRRKRN